MLFQHVININIINQIFYIFYTKSSKSGVYLILTVLLSLDAKFSLEMNISTWTSGYSIEQRHFREYIFLLFLLLVITAINSILTITVYFFIIFIINNNSH